MGKRNRRQKREMLGVQAPGPIRDLVAPVRDEPVALTLFRDLEHGVGDLDDFRASDPQAQTALVRGAVDRELDSLRRDLQHVDRFDILRRLAIRETAFDPETYRESLHTGQLAITMLVKALVREFPDSTADHPENSEPDAVERLHVGARRAIHLYQLASVVGDSAAVDPLVGIAQNAAITADLNWAPSAWPEDRSDLLSSLLHSPSVDFMESSLGFSWPDLLTVISRIEAASELLMVAGALDTRPLAVPIAGLLALPPDLIDPGAAVSELSLEQVRTIMDWLAAPLGSPPVTDVRAAVRFERLHPVLLSREWWVCPHPDLIAWAVRPRLEADLQRQPRLRERYARHRSKVLERRASDALEVVLKPDVRLDQPTYAIGGQVFESDGILAIDRYLVIIEAKSADITDRAWAGHRDRLHRDLDESTVGAASRQAGRFIRHLREHGSVHLQSTSTSFVAKSDDFEDVFCFAALLDEPGPLTSDSLVMSGIGVDLDPDAQPCIVGAHTLTTMTRLLDTPWSLLHYLHRRKITSALHDLRALEELDLVMAYLSENLYLDDEVPAIVQVESQTEALDAWEMFERGSRRRPAPKPSQRVPTYVRRVLDGLADARPPDWTAAAITILEFSDGGRRRLDAYLRVARRKVRDDHLVHDVSTFSHEPVGRPMIGITILLCPHGESMEASTQMRRLVAVNSARHPRSRWVGVAAYCAAAQIIPFDVQVSEPALDGPTEGPAELFPPRWVGGRRVAIGR